MSKYRLLSSDRDFTYFLEHIDKAAVAHEGSYLLPRLKSRLLMTREPGGWSQYISTKPAKVTERRRDALGRFLPNNLPAQAMEQWHLRNFGKVRVPDNPGAVSEYGVEISDWELDHKCGNQ